MHHWENGSTQKWSNARVYWHADGKEGIQASWSRYVPILLYMSHDDDDAHVCIYTGSTLVKECIAEMIKRGCEEIVLEAEATNMGALRLYQNLGFIRDKRLRRYYLNGNDAYRLKLLIPPSTHVDSPRVDDVTNRLAGMMT